MGTTSQGLVATCCDCGCVFLFLGLGRYQVISAGTPPVVEMLGDEDRGKSWPW